MSTEETKRKERKKLEFLILFEQRGRSLYMPMWTVGDDLMFPHGVGEYHQHGGSLISWDSRQILKGMGYTLLPHGQEAEIEIFFENEPKEKFVVSAHLIRKFRGEYQVVDGFAKTSDGRHITSELQPVDEVLLRHLPGNSFDLFGMAFGKMAELNSDFRERHFDRLQGAIMAQKMHRIVRP